MAALAGRVAWITGAGSGIGRATAMSLAGAGAAVALTGRTVAKLEETAGLVRAAGGTAVVVPADVSKQAAVAAAHAAVVAALGDPHILVNDAGGNSTARHWKELTPEIVDRVVGVNLMSAFYASLTVLPAMRARRDGVLIHIASVAAVAIHLVPGPCYTAAKHAMRAMSATLNAEEGIHGIRSVSINPGEVETPILNTRPIKPTPEQLALMAQPEDIAAAVLFCATLPPRTCVTDLTIGPTDSAAYRAEARAIAARS